MTATKPIPAVFDAKNPVASVTYALCWYAHQHGGQMPRRMIVPSHKAAILAALPRIAVMSAPGAVPPYTVVIGDQGIPLCLQEVKESPGVICI